MHTLTDTFNTITALEPQKGLRWDSGESRVAIARTADGFAFTVDGEAKVFSKPETALKRVWAYRKGFKDATPIALDKRPGVYQGRNEPLLAVEDFGTHVLRNPKGASRPYSFTGAVPHDLRGFGGTFEQCVDAFVNWFDTLEPAKQDAYRPQLHPELVLQRWAQ